MKRDEVICKVLPQFFPQHWLANPGIVFSEFPSRICIGYVLLEEGGYSYILDDQFSELQLSLQELHAAALDNLTRLPSASASIGKVPGGAEGWISATQDNFTAVRILLLNVQREFCKSLGEMFLLTLPHRDDCFCWSLTQAPERQEKHAQQALEDFLSDDYNLTPDVLLFRDGTFHLHLEQAAEPGAPPNDGPIRPLADSEGGGGPPSVS